MTNGVSGSGSRVMESNPARGRWGGHHLGPPPRAPRLALRRSDHAFAAARLTIHVVAAARAAVVAEIRCTSSPNEATTLPSRSLRRYVELFKNCRGRPWRPALSFLPLPTVANVEAEESSGGAGPSTTGAPLPSPATTTTVPTPTGGNAGPGFMRGWSQHVLWSGAEHAGDARAPATSAIKLAS